LQVAACTAAIGSQHLLALLEAFMRHLICCKGADVEPRATKCCIVSTIRTTPAPLLRPAISASSQGYLLSLVDGRVGQLVTRDRVRWQACRLCFHSYCLTLSWFALLWQLCSKERWPVATAAPADPQPGFDVHRVATMEAAPANACATIVTLQDVDNEQKLVWFLSAP
jgi:hypothetical protein